jgi:hypothetical protein
LGFYSGAKDADYTGLVLLALMIQVFILMRNYRISLFPAIGVFLVIGFNVILPQKTGDQVKLFFISGGSISEGNNNYPMVDYSRSKILMDTKNILHQKFAKRYC